ncbi:MAG: hypothetical protein J7M14_00670 [Planctomycetes bacterium]|nr:hypothetical protein [Planctomycetota bacterium]
MLPRRNMLLALLLYTVSACAGCGGKPPIGYFLSSPTAFEGVQRVVLVSLAPTKGGPEIARSMTQALFEAIQKEMLFHVDVIPRTNPACRDLTLDKLGAYTLDELAVMRSELKCDFVLFGAVTGYQTHPRMKRGLYLRMLDLRGGELIWGVEHTWDSTSKALESRMKKFFSRRMRGGYEPADWRLARMSPKTFEQFIAYEVARTLK